MPSCAPTAQPEHASAIVNESGRLNSPSEDMSGQCNKRQSRKRKAFPDRAQCFLLVNLSEASVSESQGRLGYDLSLLLFFFPRIFTSEVVVKSVPVTAASHLGEQQTADDQPRLLEVILGTVDAAQAVLHRTHKLKGELVRILRDPSPEQPQQLTLATM
ncbi:hypothetical protein FGIG_01637 [Fasciola gigantica]|uniref:Uncharacterized protein n=1 Tax=Fasciola gigantica TaxID=46835 RepID=A0A504YR32_FASGI|nr:hypothetical protein FGIG_01637 [Fasciola gigantica]